MIQNKQQMQLKRLKNSLVAKSVIDFNLIVAEDKPVGRKIHKQGPLSPNLRQILTAKDFHPGIIN